MRILIILILSLISCNSIDEPLKTRFDYITLSPWYLSSRIENTDTLFLNPYQSDIEIVFNRDSTFELTTIFLPDSYGTYRITDDSLFVVFSHNTDSVYSFKVDVLNDTIMYMKFYDYHRENLYTDIYKH